MYRYKSSQFPMPPVWTAEDYTRESEHVERQMDEAQAEQFAADVNTLAATFRIALGLDGGKPTRGGFADGLRYVAYLMKDGWGSVDAEFPQQVFEDWGPAGVLLALQRAYTQPQRVSDVIEHP